MNSEDRIPGHCPQCQMDNSLEPRTESGLMRCRNQSCCGLLYDPKVTADLYAPRSGVSDGSTAAYYELPEGATELQDLISHKDMNAQVGECFRSCYRYGESSHSDKLRDAKKIQFYINAEIARLEKLCVLNEPPKVSSKPPSPQRMRAWQWTGK